MGKKIKYIEKFRNALRILCLTKLDYMIERGDFDKGIKELLDNNTTSYTLTWKVSLLSNDILIMRFLAGANWDDYIVKKLKEIWDKEK